MSLTRPAATAATPDAPEPPTTRRRLARTAILVLIVGFAAFWTWALFFASKDAVNRIADRAWAERAEAICVRAEGEREALIDLRTLEQPTPADIAERAGLVDAATDVLERMLDDVVAVEPSDPRGREIVPMWEADYRTWLEDRRRYADELREAGTNLPFYETSIGIPISEKVATFAGDNEMPACAPPTDL